MAVDRDKVLAIAEAYGRKPPPPGGELVPAHVMHTFARDVRELLRSEEAMSDAPRPSRRHTQSDHDTSITMHLVLALTELDSERAVYQSHPNESDRLVSPYMELHITNASYRAMGERNRLEFDLVWPDSNVPDNMPTTPLVQDFPGRH